MYERHCSIFLVRISTLIPACTHGLETLFIGEAYSSLSNSSSWILVMNQPIPLPSLPVCLSHTHTQTHATITIPREVRKFQAHLHPVNSSSTVGDCSLILSSVLPRIIAVNKADKTTPTPHYQDGFVGLFRLLALWWALLYPGLSWDAAARFLLCQ